MTYQTRRRSRFAKPLVMRLPSPIRRRDFLVRIPDLSAAGGYKDKILTVLTTVLGAIDTLQQYSWILPSKYQEPVQKIEDALRKVQGWLD